MNPPGDDKYVELERLVEEYKPGTVSRLIRGKCLVLINSSGFSLASTEHARKVSTAIQVVALKYGNTVVNCPFEDAIAFTKPLDLAKDLEQKKRPKGPTALKQKHGRASHNDEGPAGAPGP